MGKGLKLLEEDEVVDEDEDEFEYIDEDEYIDEVVNETATLLSSCYGFAANNIWIAE